PRPSVIIDLDVGAKERVLILAHFDVVPVPTEQLARWSSPPHTLTQRPDGRLYGRGSNDDLGSGVVASLMAMRRLIRGTTPHRNVRLLVCCDEETGGEGGVEALKEHDARLPPRDPARFIDGDVALIPDGSPHTVAGSCGVVFMDATFASPVSLSAVVAYGRALVQLHETVRSWKSTLPSPDWPDHGAPEPVITGRATVTKFDLDLTPGSGGELPTLRSCHAETDAANQIAEAVTMVFDGPPASLALLVDRLSAALPAPFRLSREVRTSLAIPPGA
ncbi:MAG: M20/M25/M40 family metallo-hydrolase, partial [Thermoplasmata archaeon]|nr:M20/M25/M40 family metallo-hydrolase [Thermoplasmata archaeon]